MGVSWWLGALWTVLMIAWLVVWFKAREERRDTQDWLQDQRKRNRRRR